MKLFLLSIVISLAVQIVVLVRSFDSPSLQKQVLRLESALGIAVTEESADFVVLELATRQRALALGGFAGLLIGSAILTARLAPSGFQFSSSLGGNIVLLLICSVSVGSVLGLALRSMDRLRNRSDGAPRVARATAVTLEDYVHPVYRLASGLACAVVTVVVGVLQALAPSPGIVSWIFVASAIVCFAATEVVGRRLVSVGQSAASGSELAWSDAIRGMCILDLYDLPISLAIVGTMIGLTQSLGSPTVPYLGMVLPFAIVGVVILVTRIRSKRYVLTRLWPELAGAAR